MTALPPVSLVLDISALSAASPREWLEFSRVGTSHVPQVVYEEMNFLFDRSPDPDLERVARAFKRFYANSGWQITDETGHHPALRAASGQAMTKRSRVSLAVARCAYGLAQNHPANLVVLVSSDRALLQRLYDIQLPNLCGITGAALLQWCRSGQRPIAVSQKLQQMRSTAKAEAAPARSAIGGKATAIQTKTAIQQTTKGQSTKGQLTKGQSTKIQPSVPSLSKRSIPLWGVAAIAAAALLIVWAILARPNNQPAGQQSSQRSSIAAIRQ
ncbi:hypothetical protein H6F67_23905 [Microcoleus sp. FACHB-1515]|uniref:PIN domain-containing protein n=1 Tax=Cyanophyceae TaxID=3028117 RepID=UPI001683C267|nr:PIN domain-containing protein [Microcoleus sp. FACHB-1515]MBD2092898.1 hypothetical protein [Microcoleus sp. FACHB-1515]